MNFPLRGPPVVAAKDDGDFEVGCSKGSTKPAFSIGICDKFDFEYGMAISEL